MLKHLKYYRNGPTFFALGNRVTWGLVRAEEGPVLIFLDALHEKVRNPETVEEVPRALLLFAVVLLQLEEVKDVRMPGLEVHREATLALAAPPAAARRQSLPPTRRFDLPSLHCRGAWQFSPFS